MSPARRRNRRRGAPMSPPTFSASKVISSRYRFECNTSLGQTPVTAQDLLDLLCMATGTTAAYRICSAVKLRSVRMWGPMASDLKPVTCEVEYAQSESAAIGNPSTVRSDTSIGATRGACVSYAPPAGSLASFWQPRVASDELFYLTGPANSIVDIVLDQQVVLNISDVDAVGGSVSGATVGQVYVRPLDSNGSKYLQPVSYPTI